MKATIVFKDPRQFNVDIIGDNISIDLDDKGICEISCDNKQSLLIFDPGNILYVHKNLTE